MHSGAMEDEEGYMAMNLRPKQGSPSPAGNQGSHQCPGWLQVTLGAGNLILAVAVLLLVVYVSNLVSEKGQTPAAPAGDGAGSRDPLTPPGSADPSTAECSTRLERVRSQLCPPAVPGPAGGSRCKLCPMDWRLHGDKCYWVSGGSKTWGESRADCTARGSQLLVIRDREELESLKDLTQGSSQFWIGLSVSSPGKVWTWLDGSRLDQSKVPVSGRAEGNRCGRLWGTWIDSDTCSSTHQWICQRATISL